MCDTAEAEMRWSYLLVSDSVCHDSYTPTSIQNQTCYTASPETPAHHPAQPWCSRGRWDGRISSLMTLTDMHSLRDAAPSVQQRQDCVAHVRHAPKLWQLVRVASIGPRADATMPPGAAA